MRLQSLDEVGIERGDMAIVGLFLVGMLKYCPGQLVDIPGVLEVNVGKAQTDGAL